MAIVPYILCTILFLIGVYGVVSKKNLIKIIISLFIIEYATNLMLVLVGFNAAGRAPILSGQEVEAGKQGINALYTGFSDPLPQALVLTSIVIGLGVMALAVAMCIRLYEKYDTFDISEIKRLRG